MIFKKLRERGHLSSPDDPAGALEANRRSAGVVDRERASASWEDVGGAAREEFAEIRTFYLTGAGRSGTTSCARILGTAENAETVTEPAPNMALSIRAYRLGQLADPRPTIWSNRIDRMRRVLRDTRFYGEKDLKTFCWLPLYREMFNPRFVFVMRDGREAVASLLDWHYSVHGNLYLEAIDDRPLAPQAAERAAQRPRDQDLTELGRPRPTPGDPAYDGWANMTRREMLAWYWAHVTRVAQRDLYSMEDDRWTTIDYSGAHGAAEFERLFDYLELEGYDEARVDRMLAERINSLAEKAEKSTATLGPWTRWSEEETSAFDRHAAAAMVELGYYGLDRLPAPRTPAPHRADVVEPPERPLSRVALEALSKKVGSALCSGGRVLQVGPSAAALPGVAPGSLTTWSGGRLDEMPRGPFDLVCAFGVIDGCADMDRLLIQLAERTAGGLVVTAGRGHFPARIDHRYEWTSRGEARHEWCAARSRSILDRQLGFSRVRSGAVENDDPARPELTFLCADR